LIGFVAKLCTPAWSASGIDLNI